MDFLKNNLFYVILVAAVLVVSIPSFILASRRQEQVTKALADARSQLNIVKVTFARLEPVSEAALKEAEGYRQKWQDQKALILEQVKAANEHLDNDFLGGPVAPGATPDGQQYKENYQAAYDDLIARLVKANIADPKDSPLPQKADFSQIVPDNDQIRISQKQYWIVKEMTDVLTDPECGVKMVTNVALDYVPTSGALSGPDPTKTFWVYEALLEFQIDFRTFPVFLEKLLDDKNVMVFPNGYTITRSFDDSKPVYTPVAAVTLYCQVWDYINTDFEKGLLAMRANQPAKGAKQQAGKGGKGGGGAAGAGKKPGA